MMINNNRAVYFGARPGDSGRQSLTPTNRRRHEVTWLYRNYGVFVWFGVLYYTMFGVLYLNHWSITIQIISTPSPARIVGNVKSFALFPSAKLYTYLDTIFSPWYCVLNTCCSVLSLVCSFTWVFFLPRHVAACCSNLGMLFYMHIVPTLACSY